MVGPNGAGKSTILRIMAGLDVPSNGEAFLTPGATVGILEQEPQLDEDQTVLENIQGGFGEINAQLTRYHEVRRDGDQLLRGAAGGVGQPPRSLDHANAWDLDSQLEQAMDALRCPPGDQLVDVPVRRRAAPRRAVPPAARQPDLLLLDEPTNHLDAESVLWLEQFLSSYAGAVLAVTHDRYFLDNVAQWIAEVDRGRPIPYEGNYSTYLEKKAERMEVQGRKDAKLAKRLSRSSRGCAREPRRGRRSRAAAAALRGDGHGGRTHRKLDFEEIQIPPGPRLGSFVVEVQDLDKGFGDRVLIDDLSFTLPRNGIVGVIGPNGVGKTTLFKTIVGLEEPDDGTVRVGDTVRLSYVDQERAGMDPKKSVWQVVSDGLDHIKVGNVEMPSRAYVSAFGFKGPDQQKPAGVLSGGERNRLNLALTLKEGGNLILLDEPTNDLDVETLGSLENALEQFPGCAVVISHDRWFLDRIVHPHPRVGGHGRGPGRLVLLRGELRRLREEQGRSARRRGRAAASCDTPQAHPGLTVRRDVPHGARYGRRCGHRLDPEKGRNGAPARAGSDHDPDASSDDPDRLHLTDSGTGQPPAERGRPDETVENSYGAGGRQFDVTCAVRRRRAAQSADAPT